MSADRLVQTAELMEEYMGFGFGFSSIYTNKYRNNGFYPAKKTHCTRSHTRDSPNKNRPHIHEGSRIYHYTNLNEDKVFWVNLAKDFSCL